MSRCIHFDWPNEEGRTDYEALWQEEIDFCKGDRFAELLSFLFARSDIFSLRYANFNGASVLSDGKALQKQLQSYKVKSISFSDTSYHVPYNGRDTYYRVCEETKELLLQHLNSFRELLAAFPLIRFYKGKCCQFDAWDDFEGIWNACVVNVTKADIAYMIDRGFATTACIHPTPKHLEGDILPFEV